MRTKTQSNNMLLPVSVCKATLIRSFFFVCKLGLFYPNPGGRAKNYEKYVRNISKIIIVLVLSGTILTFYSKLCPK